MDIAAGCFEITDPGLIDLRGGERVEMRRIGRGEG